jgi:hypothetical protein
MSIKYPPEAVKLSDHEFGLWTGIVIGLKLEARTDVKALKALTPVTTSEEEMIANARTLADAIFWSELVHGNLKAYEV